MYDFRGGWIALDQTAEGGSRALIQLAQGGQVSSFLSLLSGVCASASWIINILTFAPAHRPNSGIHTLSWGAVGKY